MKSHFPFSMENIPRQTSFVCFSLKFGSIFSALLAILYTVLALAQCFAALAGLPSEIDSQLVFISYTLVVVITVTHGVTFILSALMLVGVLREKAHLIKPWVVWMSVQVSVAVLLFVYFTTMSMINHFANASILLYVIEFLGILVKFYMLMLVASFYKEIIETRHEKERLKDIIDHESWYTTA